MFTEADFPLAFGTHVSRKLQIASRRKTVHVGNGGQASIQHASNASSNGGSRSARVTEHVAKEWRRRQRFERCLEMQGADSVREIGAGRNCRKQFRFKGKFLTRAFSGNCVDLCCSREVKVE